MNIEQIKNKLNELLTHDDYEHLKRGIGIVRNYEIMLTNLKISDRNKSLLRVDGQHFKSQNELKLYYCKILFNDVSNPDDKLLNFNLLINEYKTRFYEKVNHFHERLYLPNEEPDDETEDETDEPQSEPLPLLSFDANEAQNHDEIVDENTSSTYMDTLDFNHLKRRDNRIEILAGGDDDESESNDESHNE